MKPVEPNREQCTTCGGLEYQIIEAGEFAKAEACTTCLAPCDLCHGEMVRYERNAAGYLVVMPCSCDLAQLTQRIERYNSAGIPARYAQKTIENFEERGGNLVALKYEMLNVRQEFQAGEKALCLSGRPGTGKTHLLTALFTYFTLERGLLCRFIDFGDLTTRIKRGYDKKMSENEIIDDLVGIPILCIDELGKGRGSEWEISVLDALVNRRYNAGKSTFFTTNFPFASLESGEKQPAQKAEKTLRNPFNPEEVEALKRSTALPTLEERIGSRIYSRLVEMCELRQVNGTDYRRRK